MKAYKNIAIKIALVIGLALFLNTDSGKMYAEDIKPLIQLIIQQ